MKPIIFFLLMTTAGWAQMVAKIPFTFEAGGVTLGKGTYQLTPMGMGPLGYLQLQEINTRAAVILPRLGMDAVPTGDRASLQFRCNTEKCALTSYWARGEGKFTLARPDRKQKLDTVRAVALFQ
jgi:hypothetical protein